MPPIARQALGWAAVSWSSCHVWKLCRTQREAECLVHGLVFFAPALLPLNLSTDLCLAQLLPSLDPQDHLIRGT